MPHRLAPIRAAAPVEAGVAGALVERLRTGQAALAGGRWQEAQDEGAAVYRDARALPHARLAAEAALLAARAAFNRCQLDAAADWCLRTRAPEAEDAGPALQAAGWVVSAAVSARLDDAAAAIDAMNRALSLLSDEMPSTTRRTVYYGVAIALGALGLWRQALGTWRAAVDADLASGPGSGGLAMSRLNLVENSLRAHDDLLASDPPAAAALLAEARAVARDLEADILWQSSPWVRFLGRHALGALARREQRHDEALTRLQAAMSEPMDAPPALRGSFWLEIAEAEQALGRPEAARASALQAIAFLDADRAVPGGAHPLWTLHDLWRAERLGGREAAALALLESYHQRRTRNLIILMEAQGAGLARQLSEQTLRLQNADLREVNADLTRSVADISRMAQTDSLTGLLNRRALESVYRGMVAAGAPFALMMIDIDHFKRVNDSHSHVVGDAVLRRIALLLSDDLRGPDAAGRYGGEEFTVLLAPAAAVDAHAVAERLRHRVAAFDWAGVAPGLAITISLGFVLAQGGETFEQAVARADALLYLAKQGGRDRVVGEPRP